MYKQSYPKFESASGYGTLSGIVAGAGLSALLSWLHYRKKKNQSLGSRWLKGLGWTALGGLAGGLAGAYGGRMYARHQQYKELRDKITNDLKDTEKVPGRVIYVDCIDNRHTPREGLGKKVVEKMTNGGLPTGHSMLAVIDGRNNMMSIMQVNTLDPEATKKLGYGLMASAKKPDGSYDRDQVIMGYNAVRRAAVGGTPVLTNPIGKLAINIGKDATDEDIALYIGSISRGLGFGDRVVLHEGSKCSDIRLPIRFMHDAYWNALRDGGGGYSAVPGGYNCGTAAREAFDVAQDDQSSHWRDMLWGGGSTANAPSLSREWSNR